MKNTMHKKLIMLISLSCLLVLTLCLPLTAFADETSEVTVLFTHDVHSHAEQYARLATLIDEQRAIYPEALLVDGGDFAMGTLLQAIYPTHGAELRLMGQMGYEAVILGNHEFDYRTDGIISMLQAAKESGDILPYLLFPNFDRQTTDEEALKLLAALDDFDCPEYLIVEKNGVRIGLFALLGVEARSNAPTCPLDIIDPIEYARTTVAKIKDQEEVDLIIALSHSGTNKNQKKSEDEQLALAVPDLDLIISAHSHTLLEEPITHGHTHIVSADSYGAYLGSLTLKPNAEGRWDMSKYELLAVDEKIRPDSHIAQQVASFMTEVSDTYLASFGYRADQVLAENPIAFTESSDLGRYHIEQPLGSLMADAYRVIASEALDMQIDLAIAPSGTIRDTYPQGDLTVTQVYNSSSLGIGPDKVPGYPLVQAYLTGEELMILAEIDASISDFMTTARLYNSGLSFTFNPSRMILNKVTDVYLNPLHGYDFTTTEITPIALEKDKLYSVTTDLYSCQMLSAVTDMSYGILTVQPKYADGSLVENIEDCIVYLDGKELKTWQAIALYLESLPENKSGVPTVPQYYAEPHERKVVENDKNIFSLLKAPNKYALCIYGVILILFLLVAGGIRLIYRKMKK